MITLTSPATTATEIACAQCHLPIAIGTPRVIEIAPGEMGSYHVACVAPARLALQAEEAAYRARTRQPARRPATESAEVNGYMIDRGEDN